MLVHNIYIFDRDGVCLYYHEWLRTKPVSEGAGNLADDQKSMFGLFFSLKTFAAAMDPKYALNLDLNPCIVLQYPKPPASGV